MKNVDYVFNHTNFCLYDNDVVVKPMYVKLLKKGDSKYRVVALFFY